MYRIRNKIVYNETGLYKVNQVSERYIYQYYSEQPGPFIRVLYQSAYQICNVYTNQNTVLSAFQKLNGAEATNQVFLDHGYNYIPLKYHKYIRKKIVYKDTFNCHGFTFLDGGFWFELDNETVDLILEEDNYKECTWEELGENGICLYYNEDNELIHSARKVKGELLSKFGINQLLTKGQKSILKRYKDVEHKNTRYYNR